MKCGNIDNAIQEYDFVKSIVSGCSEFWSFFFTSKTIYVHINNDQTLSFL